MTDKQESTTSAPQEPTPVSKFALCDYLDQLVESLRGHIRAALEESEPDAVHDARVATRRLGAAMKLLGPAVDDKTAEPFKAVLKKLRRRLGPLRDMDVMVGHAEELPRTGPAAGAAVWLTRQLTERRDAERKQTRRKDSPSKLLAKVDCWIVIRNQLVDSKDKIDSLLTQSIHLQLDAFAEQADRLAAGAALDVHELRIAGKSLRYTLEMAAAHGQKLPKRLFSSFKHMQDALGMWHDFVVMTERAMSLSVDAGLPCSAPQTQMRVLDLTRLFLKRSTRELATFSRLWSAAGAALAATIRESFPMSPSLNEPQTGPDLPHSAEIPPQEAPPQDAVLAEPA